MKKVLVVYYTQTGQLREILDRVTLDLQGDDVDLTWYRIKPDPPFPFPWEKNTFYHIFPETHAQETIALDLNDDAALKEKYDLIILGYQVWFLTPSMPINSFLKHPIAKPLFDSTPVVTVIGCRNMWIMAQEKMKALLAGLNAKLIGHIALVDRHINHISVITIAHWMFSGRKDRYLGFFPKPGVSDRDINNASRFGKPIRRALISGDHDKLQPALIEMDAVRINSMLLKMDQRGNFLFGKWAAFIKSRGPIGSKARNAWLRVFSYYLHAAIWLLAPVVLLVFAITYPLRLQRIRKDQRYYSSVQYLPDR